MSVCWFCEKNPPTEKATISITLHYEMGRDYAGLPPAIQITTVHYKKERKKVIIPRCDICKTTMSGEPVRNFLLGSGVIGSGILILLTYRRCFIRNTGSSPH